jgi:threonine synthase
MAKPCAKGNIMANTTFSGPVTSTNGFVGDVTGDMIGDFVKLTATDTASLPAAAAGNAGQVRLINDNGSGDDEYCLVVSTGSAWVTAVGAALS